MGPTILNSKCFFLEYLQFLLIFSLCSEIPRKYISQIILYQLFSIAVLNFTCFLCQFNSLIKFTDFPLQWVSTLILSEDKHRIVFGLFCSLPSIHFLAQGVIVRLQESITVYTGEILAFTNNVLLRRSMCSMCTPFFKKRFFKKFLCSQQITR